MDFDNLAQYLQHLFAAALGGVGVLLAGLLKASSDNRRVRADDRGLFTAQLMERLTQVEKSLADERAYCAEQMQRMDSDYKRRLENRDRIITELRQRVSALEDRAP